MKYTLKLTIRLLISVSVSALFLPSAFGWEKSISIPVGRSEVFDIDNIQRISVGNGEVVSAYAVENDSQLLVIANTSGKTDVRVWAQGGVEHLLVARVVTEAHVAVYSEVSQLIEGIEGLELSKTDEHIILSGQLLRKDDVKVLEYIKQRYPEIIDATVPPIFNLDTMILLDVKVVEMNRNDFRDIGVNWEPVARGFELGLQGVVSSGSDVFYLNDSGANKANYSQTFLGINTNILSMLHLLEKRGNARMLAEPQLVAKSGKKAEFLAGGEIPIPIVSSEGDTNVVFKEYGVILNIEPRSDSQGFIDAHIEVEVSTVDNSVSAMGVPGFLTRKTDTEVNVQSGETIVLSGLLSSQQSKVVNKVPGIGSIPILGELFKSREFRDNQTELVIFVTPKIITPDGDQNNKFITRAEELEHKFVDDLKFSILD